VRRTCASTSLFLTLFLTLSLPACSIPGPRGPESDLADVQVADLPGPDLPGPDLASGDAAAPPRPFHVFLFIGDGMGRSSEIVASRYLYGRDDGLAWHDFPFDAWVATWDVATYDGYAAAAGRPAYDPASFDPDLGYDPARAGAAPWPLGGLDDPAYVTSRATDSAAAATALATGIKSDPGNVAWACGDPEHGEIPSIVERVRERLGAATGVVTTVPFNHATPAGFLAHATWRGDYGGIADQIVAPAGADVVIGGGHPDTCASYLDAGRLEILRDSPYWNLVERRSGVDGGEELLAAARETAPSCGLFGLFGGGDGTFVPDGPEDPTLAEALEAAVAVLSRNPRGFLLVLEQGDIDWANHGNDLPRLLGTMTSLDEAVRAAVALVDRPGDAMDRSNSLVIVTADHATGMPRFASSGFLAKGEVPVPSADAAGDWDYVGGRVEYLSGSHGNELVTLAAWGDRAGELFGPWVGRDRPGTRILDNTSIHEVIARFSGL
jgi:alkaline phosphatase